ncbi:hypothetical protein HZA38_05915 [Candidatus Peregrinibacteria bacterium]|nr:hypothetical protein [Candidatus Peregrinibacteria bacterium]
MTVLLYLSDTYLFLVAAKVLEIRNTEKGKAIILDQTIFYPQGGGQPADFGEISSNTAVFAVTDVRLDETGTVLHYGNFFSGTLKNGDEVTLTIDSERRTLNARLHSAGHLLDVAVQKSGITGLVPTKGYHFPEGPYVEYKGELKNPQEYISKLEEILTELVAAKILMEKIELSPEEAQKRQIFAPPGKAARVVNFQGYEGCGCGGTHVRDSGEIGKMTIRKISSKNGVTRVAYALENTSL